QGPAHVLAERGVVFAAAAHADHDEMGREELPTGQGEYRWEELPGRQVAGGAEHHQGKRVGHPPVGYEWRAIHGVLVTRLLVWSRGHFLRPPNVEPFRCDQPCSQRRTFP